MKDTIKIFQINDDLLPDAYKLYKQVLKGRDKWKVFSAKFDLTNKIGICSTIAYDGKKPVGFVGIIRHEFNLNGQLYYCGMGCDFAIHKHYRHQGLFSQLIDKSGMLAKSYNYLCLYGLQSDLSYKATSKLGWQPTNNQLALFKLEEKTNKIMFLRYQLANRFLGRDLPFSFVPYVDKKRQIVLTESNNSFSINLNSAFIQYKTIHKNYFINLHDCLFWVRFQSHIEICYTQFNHLENLRKAITKIKTCARNSGLKGVLIYAGIDSNLYKYLIEISDPIPAWKITVAPLQQSELCFELRAQAIENDGF